MRLWRAILAVFAGLFGASGVAAAAAAAHIANDASLHTAADFLLFHAAALLALVAAERGQPHRGVLAAGTLIAAGTVLFSGDLAMRVLAGVRLLPLAAPTGGLLLIAGWLTAALALPLAMRDGRVS